jgi:hypothetical protein
MPPSATSGRKRSVLLLAYSVVVALIFQYGLAPYILSTNENGIVPGWKYLSDAWTSGCDAADSDDQDGSSMDDATIICAGNSGVYRSSSATFTFFCIFGIAAKCRPTSNREAWLAKYTLVTMLNVGTIFIPNTPIFIPIYLWVARVGSVLFVTVQQVILVDIAYNWNSSWLTKSEQAELADGPGMGKKWLAAILVSCGVLYTLHLIGIIAMYIYFSGCANNIAFISITLIMSCICTVVQLTISDSASLLTSACMTLYATYLCGAAVSQNPNTECNPFLGGTDRWNIVLGLSMAFISLMWTGWSYTTDKQLGGGGTNAVDVANDRCDEAMPVGGLVLSSSNNDNIPSESTKGSNTTFASSWKLNAVLATVCCWYAMSLTGWGATQKRGDVSNPNAGEASMWMLISSQWIALLLYFWTLVAPSLFPDRDFS